MPVHVARIAGPIPRIAFDVGGIAGRLRVSNLLRIPVKCSAVVGGDGRYQPRDTETQQCSDV